MVGLPRTAKAALPLALATLTVALSGQATSASAQEHPTLPPQNLLVKSAVDFNLDHSSVTLPLHRGEFRGKTVWYVITESSDFGLAHDLNVNFSPKLANMGVGCPRCVQDVRLTGRKNNRFGEGIVHFRGVPDFRPRRRLVAGTGGFPPAVAQPGAVGDARYSPFIRIKGSSVVYNAPIVATGRSRFDVTHHANTADRVLAIHRRRTLGPARFEPASVELLVVHGLEAGQKIFYLSTEASLDVAATLERATFVPLLNRAAFKGGDDFLGSARERIFIFANGQTGADNPQAQGLAHLIKDGHASEDANLKNTGLLEALRNDGDALNVLGDFPSLADPRHANAYSPLWDAQLGMWSQKAVAAGLNTRQDDENEILNLAATRPDLLTGPMGTGFGAVGFVINCPTIAFVGDHAPDQDQVELVAGAQG